MATKKWKVWNDDVCLGHFPAPTPQAAAEKALQAHLDVKDYSNNTFFVKKPKLRTEAVVVNV